MPHLRRWRLRAQLFDQEAAERQEGPLPAFVGQRGPDPVRYGRRRRLGSARGGMVGALQRDMMTLHDWSFAGASRSNPRAEAAPAQQLLGGAGMVFAR